jgi:hypothetical protein
VVPAGVVATAVKEAILLRSVSRSARTQSLRLKPPAWRPVADLQFPLVPLSLQGLLEPVAPKAAAVAEGRAAKGASAISPHQTRTQALEVPAVLREAPDQSANSFRS